MQVVNCAGLVSKWVGDTPKNIDALFQEARATDAVLCFDEAEGLFGTRSSDMGNSTDRYAAMDVGEQLYQLALCVSSKSVHQLAFLSDCWHTLQ